MQNSTNRLFDKTVSAPAILRITRPAIAVALVEIDNPPANALTEELYAAINKAVVALERDMSTRAVIIASAHRSTFVAGADIKAMATYDFSRAAVTRKVSLVHDCFLRLQRLSKPTIAAIEGHALGGGCELALTCDFRLMARGKARIGLTEAALGLIPGGGGTQRLTRLIGRARAIELMLLARRLDADEAVAIGLVNTACDSASLRPAAFALADQLAAMPRSSLRLIKLTLNDGFDADLESGLAVERKAAVEAVLSVEAREGIAAFIEKREPQFH